MSNRAPRRVPRGHRTAELRSIALHRVVAERLDDALLARARERVEGWIADEEPVPRLYAERWRELLAQPLDEIRRALVEDTEEMRDMRQSSPFAGVVPEQEWLRIIREVW